MFYIQADNVDAALCIGLKTMLENGVYSTSRNGQVLRLPYPVVTEYTNPRCRVLHNPVRNANPFFHLMEAMWMLRGRNDIKFVSYFNKRMAQYSDDAVTQPAAYGYRWRRHFDEDQIKFVIEELKRDNNTRRAIVTMADPAVDVVAVQHGGADVPCNTSVYFIVRPDGRLDMTVSNRSNDAIWGAYGANMVHMSILHEYVALAVSIEMGTYYQISNDLHAYTDVFDNDKLVEMSYRDNAVHRKLEPRPLWGHREHIEMFDSDLQTFFDYFDAGEFQNMTQDAFITVWFQDVVAPMFAAWCSYKNGSRSLAAHYINQVVCPDWGTACAEWLTRAWAAKDSA